MLNRNLPFGTVEGTSYLYQNGAYFDQEGYEIDLDVESRIGKRKAIQKPATKASKPAASNKPPKHEPPAPTGDTGGGSSQTNETGGETDGFDWAAYAAGDSQGRSFFAIKKDFADRYGVEADTADEMRAHILKAG